jgi:hypothetical protein
LIKFENNTVDEAAFDTNQVMSQCDLIQCMANLFLCMTDTSIVPTL